MYTILVVLLVPSIGAGVEDKRANQVDPHRTTIIGVAAGYKESDVVKILGKPRSVTSGYSELEDKPWKQLHYNDARINFIDSEIYGLSCVGVHCATERGLKIGDPRAKVIQAYGAGNQPYPGASEDTLSYPLTGSDVYLVFVFRNQKVIEIRFFMDFS